MLNAAEQAVSTGRLVRKGAARAAIVQAARRVAERDGMEHFSLSAVATEAGFGPSTVFGHFRNKDELLAAIVAEDLATMAALMRETPAAQEAASDAANLEAEPFQAHEDDLALSRLPEVVPEPDADATPPEPSHPAPGDDLATSHHGESGSSGRSPVDAWLERRLRTFERGLTDLEHRMKETEAGTSWAVAISRDTTDSVTGKLELLEVRQSEALQNLNRRMEETEQRQRGATSEMRAAMNDTATRIEILEAARRTDPTSALSSDVGPVAAR